MSTSYSDPKIPKADSGQTVLDTEGIASLGELPTITIIDNGELLTPSQPGDPYGKIRSVYNIMFAGTQYTISFQVFGVEWNLYMGSHFVASGSASPGIHTVNVNFTPNISWPDLDEGNNTLTLTANYYTPTVDTATVYIADKENCWESLASATSYELIATAAENEESSWLFDNYIDGSQIALVLKPSNNVLAEITSCPTYLWYNYNTGGVSANIGIDINLNLYYQLLVGAEVLADGYGSGTELVPITPILDIGDGAKTVTLNVYYQDYIIKSDTDNTTFVTAQITTNPEDLYYGSASNTVVVDVTDGYGWSLTVDGEAAATGTGTGANQNATFAPTAAMVGEDVTLLLTAGESTHEDTITVHRSQIVSAPKMYVGYESNLTVNCTDYTTFIPYINSEAATTEKTGTGSNQNVAITPTADMEGVGVAVELKHGAIVGGHTTATVVGVELITVPDPIYPDVECTFVVNVTDDESFTLKINNVTAATGTGTGANQDVTFNPTSSMIGEDVEVLLSSGYAEDGYTTNCLADVSFAGYESYYNVNDSSSWSVNGFHHSEGSNRIWLLFVTARHAASASTSASIVVDDGDPISFHKIAQINISGYTTASISAFYLLESELPEGEYYTPWVSVTSGTILATMACQFNNVKQSAPAYDADTAYNSEITSTVTTVANKAVIVGFVGTMDTSYRTFTPQTGQTVIGTANCPKDPIYNLYLSGKAGYEQIATGGAETMTWSSAITYIAQILLALEPVS
jgi:hypothetical protein